MDGKCRKQMSRQEPKYFGEGVKNRQEHPKDHPRSGMWPCIVHENI